MTRLAVPDLLDRTWPQVQRILEDMGFVAQREAAAHGPPNRVADQAPAAGAPLARGETVVVWIAPPRRPSSVDPGAAPALPVGGQGALQVIAPLPGANVGSAPSLVLGFAWHPVPGANTYLLEIEEASDQAWTGIHRQVVRRTGALLDIERLANPPGVLRWRVAAIRDGRPAEVSAWVELP